MAPPGLVWDWGERVPTINVTINVLSKNIKIFKIFPMTISFFPTEKITVYSAWTCFSNVISKTHMWPSRNGLDWTERYLLQETSDNNLRKLWGKSIELFEN